MINSRGELREWVKVSDDPPTYQGYSYNDPQHSSSDGTFTTVIADSESRNHSGLILYKNNQAWWLWYSNAHKPKTKDLFDES